MDATTLLITVYCLIDDWLAGRRLRQRGPTPTLSDSEVLTIECVGEFLGIDTDKGLYEHFCRYWGDLFPALSRVHRTTFVRQAANLWAVKAQLRQQLLGQISFDPAISILDSFPMPVCRFGRAYRCRRLAELASFGRDEGAKQTYYGLRAHLRVCWPGVITDARLVPANRTTSPWPRSYWPECKVGRWGIGPTGAHPGPGCWPTKACGCWRRHDRSTERGRACPAGLLKHDGGSRR
jgi:hypothetical protein